MVRRRLEKWEISDRNRTLARRATARPQKRKKDVVVVKLICPAGRCDRPHVAEATVDARLTPKQIVIAWQRHPRIVYVNGHTQGPTGIGDMRFWRHNGSRVGGEISGSWDLALGELERTKGMIPT